MPEKLTDIEIRILGSLVEKQLTTPEYYPLTMHALIAACNQKSNRDPVVSYDEDTVTPALDNLREKNLVYLFYGSTSRVVKYKHMLPGVFELEPPETAVMCVMMLRGPQTPGELRGRTDRLYEFSGIGEVQETVDRLIRRERPLVVKLERQPGQKEARFAHLLAGDIEVESLSAVHKQPVSDAQPSTDHIERLELEIENLRSDLTSFRKTFEEFRKQFD